MRNTIGTFCYSLSKLSARDDCLPFDPFLVLHLKQWGRVAADGPPTISANLVSDVEIDEHIRNLKADLDAVGTAAKQALRQAREATAEIVRQRNKD